jgi:iron complex transport system permease protein
MKRILVAVIFLAIIASLFLLSLQTGIINLDSSLLNLIGKRTGIDAITVWEVRAPRALGAIVIGSALGIAGVIAQSIFRNPLAEPTLIGLTSGASLGSVVAISTGAAVYGSTLNALFAILFSALAGLSIYLLAPANGLGFLITGIAGSAVFISIAGLLITISPNPGIQNLSFWNFGSLAMLNNSTLKVISPLIAIGIGGAYFVTRKLDIYSLGENSAHYLGVNSGRVRLIAIGVLALLVGPAVSSVGAIAFLGLLVPHVVRLLIGPSHKNLFFFSALLGAALLLGADLLARAAFAPHEIPLGLLTSIIGAPVLIILLKIRVEQWVSND